MTPEYEVKLLLKPIAVLSPKKELMSTVVSTFDMPPSVAKQSLTYKKRYAIVGGDIDAALTTANNDGFDVGDAGYEAQVEWGYQRQTLSISRKKTVTDSINIGIDLPGERNSREILVDKAPVKFDNWMHDKWGTGALAESRIFGLVPAKSSIGTWEGMRLYIEVWPIRNRAHTGIDYLVEASFKTKNRTTASTKHGSLISYLQDKGWFLEEDSLKTQIIMEHY
ncbi:hypothetical protein B0T10DRAFT_533572 [Thelonectria olida]|uniref:Uncharacterized protein n=1 Tax=Thelonectria olida TaxID=1576542 RepID=A0A9P9AEV1_9HYPO|nr:hypothetical protein B0T10DRAFT_533572 [Thelonectria olida]